MTIKEARDAIDRLHDADYNLTEDMREDLRRLHDSVDEQEGMESYWKRHDEELANLSRKFDDFRRDYVNFSLTGRAAVEAHERDMRGDDFEEKPSNRELIGRMFTSEHIGR